MSDYILHVYVYFDTCVIYIWPNHQFCRILLRILYNDIFNFYKNVTSNHKTYLETKSGPLQLITELVKH